MPRTSKESDDESEIKTGRRTKAAAGTNAVDSPLRRSTRHRQAINHDISPDTVNNAAGPQTRTTRRKAAQEAAESTRTLRSRRTSTTSDTSECHDSEANDVKKTKKAAAAATAPETPTTRSRRSVRAGSESKTLPSPSKNRKTRASSLDLEERAVVQSLQIHLGTPLKTRKRASVIPSEPALIEETEKEIIRRASQKGSRTSIVEGDSKVADSTIADDNNKVDALGSTPPQSPSLHLNISSDSNDIETKKDIEGFALKSISEEVYDSQTKRNIEEFNKSSSMQINDLITSNSPKVVIEKIKSPIAKNYESLEKSPGNKENETLAVNKLTFLSSHEVPTQRKSLSVMASEKIFINKRLNKSIDERVLSSDTDHLKISTPLRKKSLEDFEGIEQTDNNVFSVSIGPGNESVIIVEQIMKPNQTDYFNDDMDDKKNASLIDASVSTNDANNTNSEADKVIGCNQVETLIDNNGKESINVLNTSVRTDDANEEDVNEVLELNPMEISNDNNITVREVIAEMDISVDTNDGYTEVLVDKASEEYSVITETDIPKENKAIEESVIIVDEVETNISRRQSETVKEQAEKISALEVPVRIDRDNEVSSSITEADLDIKEPADEAEIFIKEEYIIAKTEDIESLLNEPQSTSNTPEIVESYKAVESESDNDATKLFKDIPADEWDNGETSQSVEHIFVDDQVEMKNDEIEILKDENEKTDEIEKDSDSYELVLVDKKAWEAAEEERQKKMQLNEDSDSTDTLIMQLHSGSNRPAEPPASPLLEEPMDIDEDYNEVDVNKPTEDIINKSYQSLSKQVTFCQDILDQGNEDNEKESTKDESLNSGESNISINKSPIRRITPMKVEYPRIIRKITPFKLTDNDNLLTRKSLDSSILVKKSDDASVSRKSLSKSILLNDNVKAKDKINESEDYTAMYTYKVETVADKTSLNKSTFEKSQKLESTNGDIDVNTLPVLRLNNNNLDIEKSIKNVSLIAQANSDSEADSLDTENSEDPSNPILPTFLYAGSSSSSSSSNSDEDEDSSTIDSDVAREYNLNGSSVSEYSDDNVPGDMCRASETESSGSDHEEDDDMMDFIVGDDEIDEEVEDEESETDDDDDDDMDEKEVEDEDVQVDGEESEVDDEEEVHLEEAEVKSDEDEDQSEDEDEEQESNEDDEDEEVDVEEHDEEVIHQELDPDGVTQIRSVKKHLEFNSSVEHDESSALHKFKNEPTYSESRLLRANKYRQSWNELCENSISNTPRKVASVAVPSETGIVEKKEMSSKKSKPSDTELNKSRLNKSNTNSIKSTKKNKSLNKSGKEENSFHIEDTIHSTKPSTSIYDTCNLSRATSFNKSLVAPYITSPETISLLKEKFNDSLPALKLEPRARGRKSSLYFVEEVIHDNEKDDEDASITAAMGKKTIDKSSKEKKKKKTKTTTNGFTVENTSNEVSESSPILNTQNERIQKKKKVKKETSVSPELSIGSLKKKNIKKEKRFEVEVTEKRMKKKKKEKSIDIEEPDEIPIHKTQKRKIKSQNSAIKNKRKRSEVDLDETTFTVVDDADSPKVVYDTKKKNNSKQLLKSEIKIEKPSTSAQYSPFVQSNVKRLSEDILHNLSDVPVQPKKKRKLSIEQKMLPSKSMFDYQNPKPENFSIEDEGYIPLSCSGGTTSFYVMNLEKPKKSKKLAAVYSFRDRMLRRNPRQPVSAYMMYQQKIKASNREKY